MKNKKLKIAIFCATEFAIPPSNNMKDIYAPLWLTHYITEGLVKRGHKVTLFASSDSKTKAKLVSDNLISLGKNKKFKPFYQQISEMSQAEILKNESKRKGAIFGYDFLLISRLCQAALRNEFDIVYLGKIGLHPLPFAALCPCPTVLTQHSPLDKLSLLILGEYKKRYSQMHFVALTKSHAKPNPKLFAAIVNNGIDLKQFKLENRPGDYLLIVGRLDKEKGIHEAIQAANLAKERLLIVGRKIDGEYWRKEIKPYLNDKIKYEGFVPYQKMPKYFRKAKALLFPIQWEEPFGLVMAEAMACGAPVVAFKRGSVPEVLKDNKTGFIVPPFDQKGNTNMDSFVQAIKKINQIKRTDCRRWVEEKFSLERMVDGYEKLFYKVLAKQK